MWVNLALILNPFHSQVQKANLFEAKCIRDVVRIGSIIIFRLCKLWKAKFFILCDVMFLVRLMTFRLSVVGARP